MTPSPYCCPSPPRPAGTQPRQSADQPGKEYGPPQRYPHPKGRYDTLCPFSRPYPSQNNVMIPGAFESEITKIPPMDEVLRRSTGVCDGTSESAERPTEVRNQKSKLM